MYALKIFITLVTLLILNPLYAQDIMGGLKRKVNQKINQKLEEKINTEIEESSRSISNQDSSYTDTAQYSRMLQQMMGFFQNPACEVKDNYTFKHKIYLEMQAEGKSKKENYKGKFIYYINPDSLWMGVEAINFPGDSSMSEETKSIINLKDSCSIILMDMDGKKVLSSSKMGNQLFLQNEQVDSSMYTVPQKTGKTKTIDGILCHQYISEDKDMMTEFWVEDAHVKAWEANRSQVRINGANQMYDTNFGNYYEWFPKLMITTDKNKGTRTTLKVVKREKNIQSNISTIGYKQMSLDGY